MLNVLNCLPLLYHHECFRKKNTFAFNKLFKFRPLEMALMKRSFWCYFSRLVPVSNACNDDIRLGFPVLHKLNPNCKTAEAVFLNVYGTPESIPRNEFRQPCSLAGRYDNPLPPRFLAPLDSLKIPDLDTVFTGELMQPGQSATYLKTTAARKISTNQFRSAHTEFSLM
jgi:hypothetical protein